MPRRHIHQHELLEALWEIDNDREIESITIDEGDGVIKFCDGEEITIQQGVKRYKAEILGEYCASDPETYPEFVRKAFRYYNKTSLKNLDLHPQEIAGIAAYCFCENEDQYYFIWDCFMEQYPEFHDRDFMIEEYSHKLL